MPAEEAGPNNMARGESIRKEIDAFNRNLAGRPLTVLNTQPPLDTQLEVWNPEFAIVNWAVIASQRLTLKALERFATTHQVHVNVRFVTWGEAFEELRGYRRRGPKGPPPNVAQVGSTWTAYLANNGQLVSRPGWEQKLAGWRKVLNTPASALPYINDIRMLFYWKRLPSADPGSAEFVMKAATWQAILESMRDSPIAGDTLAVATGLTLNLLHDYASLVWAGGGNFLDLGLRKHLDLTSARALQVPILIAQHARYIDPKLGPRRLVAFPETSHEEVTRLFVNGGYRGTIEPANFISRWWIDFNEKRQQAIKRGERHSQGSFWDYAGAVVPPVPFKGGSDLVVLSGTQQISEAFKLAEFLATDPEYTEALANFGHLPSLREGYGVDVLVRALADQTGSSGSAAFTKAVQEAIVRGKHYPDLDVFPTELENRQVLEALQRVWRRMGDGDAESLRSAAREAEAVVNRRVDWSVQLTDDLRRSWRFAALPLFGVIGLYLWSLRLERDRILGGQLYLANLHTILPSYGTRLSGAAARARKGLLTADEFLTTIQDYSDHLAGPFYTHTCHVSGALCEEMMSRRGRLSAREVISRAHDGARVQFKAAWMAEAPIVNMRSEGSDEWEIGPMPHLAIVVLQEWFYNTLRELSTGDNCQSCYCIHVEIKRSGVRVQTPLSIASEHVQILHSKPGKKMRLIFSGMGLPLIRNLMYFGYRRRPRIEFSDARRGTQVHFPFPMRPAKKSIDGASSHENLDC